jgi:hypothetical protein
MTSAMKGLRNTAGMAVLAMMSGCSDVDESQAPIYTAPTCRSETTLPPGLSSWLVGTWQDWKGTYKVYTFDGEGKVSIASFQAPKAGAVGRESSALVIENSGQYTLTNKTLDVTWNDAKTESTDLTLLTEPGCVMLGLHQRPNAERGRLSSLTDLERVHCKVAPVELGNPTVNPSKTDTD